jgi:hypothetical protein
VAQRIGLTCSFVAWLVLSPIVLAMSVKVVMTFCMSCLQVYVWMGSGDVPQTSV